MICRDAVKMEDYRESGEPEGLPGPPEVITGVLMTRGGQDEMSSAGGLADLLSEGAGPGQSDPGVSGPGPGALPGRRVWPAGL